MPILGEPIAVGRTAEIYAWDNHCILKLTRTQFPAHLADQEWFKAQAAWQMGAPAPHPVELIEVDGRRGVVFQHIPGRNMLQEIQRTPWRLDHFARLLGRTHAGLHRLSAPAFPSLHERIHWSLAQPNLLSERRKSAIVGLVEQLPDAATLCHADFHPENILLAKTGPVIIDWEGSLHGEPGGDVAITCLWIRSAFMTGGGLMRRIGQRFEKGYLSSYQQAHGPLTHLPEWLALHAACKLNEENRSKIPLIEQTVRRVIPGW